MPVDENTLLTGGGDATTDDATIRMWYMETADDIARNWKSLICVGLWNVLTGSFCIVFPMMATQVAEYTVISLVLVNGAFNMLSVCFTSNDSSRHNHNHHTFWMGLMQVLLGVMLFNHQRFALTLLTFVVAVAFMFVGSIQVSLARRYREQIAARALMYMSGVMAIGLSVIICLSMPTAKFYTIGTLLGVNLINVGMNRVAIGMYGRKLAAEDASSAESWRTYMEADLL